MFLSIIVLIVTPGTLVMTAIILALWKRRRQMILQGFKAVLITGCDRGFGYLLAKRLDAGGYKVFAGCLDAEGEGAATLQRESSSRLELLQLDVTNDEQIEAARSTVVDLLSGHMLWAVVNNAGIANHAEFEWYPKASFKKLMDVNFMGLVNVTRAFLPLVRASKGRIINIASMAGRTAIPGFTAYSASKFAVIGFSDSLRREMSHFGVRVITVEPATYKTDLANTDTILAHNDTFWAIAESGVKRDYGENYFNCSQVARKRLFDWACKDVSQVIDCLEDAVTSKHPRYRYVSPTRFQLLNDTMNMLGLGLQDAIIKRVMGVTAKPGMLSSNMIDNCRIGRRRSYAT